jgi:hypothetical protein
MVTEEDADPFRKRPVLLRTPEKEGPAVHTSLIESQEFDNDPKSLKEAIARMGSILEGLSAVIFNKGQRHINQLMKDEITMLMSIQKRASTLCMESGKNSVATVTCPLEVATTSNSTQTDRGKYVQHISTDGASHRGTPKRPRDPLSGTRKTPPKKPKNAAKGPVAGIEENSVAGDKVPKKPQGDGWTKVQRTQNRRVRQDAIVLTGKGCTYADLLKSVRGDPALQHLSGDVQAVRKTAKGDLLLRLNKTRAHSTKELEDAVGKAIGDRAAVRSLADSEDVVIRDLDELVTKDEVQAAVDSALEGNGATIKSLRMTQYGTQIALLSLPVAKARKLCEQGKIRIGWTVCRIQMQPRLKRCYKCSEFGHIAANCKSTTDNSGKCYKCGLPGHKAKGCENPPKCLLCTKDTVSGNRKQADHITGSFKCPAYKEAIKKLKC